MASSGVSVLATSIVSAATTTAATITVPLVKQVATDVGDVVTQTLNDAGSGITATEANAAQSTSMLPDTLYHYTHVGPDIIMNEGLNADSGITFATNTGGLSPSEAQTGLYLNLDNPLPTNVYSIDVSAVINSGRNIYGPFTITGPDGLPTGYWQWVIDDVVPPDMLGY